MKLAIVGATGLVGQEVLRVLETSALPIQSVILVASRARRCTLHGTRYRCYTLSQALAKRPEVAIFSAGQALSLRYAPLFVAQGTLVVDNSAAWRMHTSYPLIVPEINAHLLSASSRLIANPNCSAIQLAMVLAPLHHAYGLREVIVSTYQAMSGAGRTAVTQWLQERKGKPSSTHSPLDNNLMPAIGAIDPTGTSEEEAKIQQETQKLLSLPQLPLQATCVRVPLLRGHAQSVHLSLEKTFRMADIVKRLTTTQGLKLYPDTCKPPTPYDVAGKDDVYVGRLRTGLRPRHSLQLWTVADNLRKGAATNAVQIVHYMHEKGWIG